MVSQGSSSFALRRTFNLILSLALLLSAVLSNVSGVRAQSVAEAPGIKTDHRAYAEPALPALPRAGGKWRDAVFGTELMRATDESDHPSPGLGTYYSHWPTFNSDATRLLIRKGESGTAMVKGFDPVRFELLGTERAQMPQLPDGTSATWEGATWHHADPDVIFVHANYANSQYPNSGMKLYEYRVSSNSYALVKDFDGMPGAAAGKDYLGQMYMSGDSDVFCFLRRRVDVGVVGYVVWRRSDDRVLAWVDDNTYAQGINEVQLDRSGRWAFVSLNHCQPGCVRQIVRNLVTGQESEVRYSAEERPTGHGDVADAAMVGFDGYRNTIHLRRFDDPLHPRDLFSFTTEGGQDDWTQDFHGTSGYGGRGWMTIGTYDVPGMENLPEYHIFEDEVMEVALDGTGRVRRLAHTRSAVDNLGPSSGYWAMPKPTVSRDGRYVAFTSNWENSGRYDLFILKVDGVQSPTPTPTPAPTPAPAPTPSATPTPAPQPTPAPSPGMGYSRDSLGRTKRHAQTVSNELAAAFAASAENSQSFNPLAVTTVTQSAAQDVSAVVSNIEKTRNDFLADQGAYQAAVRIDATLIRALGLARDAEASAQQSQFFELKGQLRKAIEFLELANVLMTYGDISDPLSAPEFFVRQHYVDFLDREPDESGFQFWVGQLAGCDSEARCEEAKRVNVSASYFLSIEFQQTGYMVYRAHKAAFGRRPLLREFSADSQAVMRGVIVGVAGWQERLESNTRLFFEEWVRSDAFRALYAGMSDERFIDSLIANSGVAVSSEERARLISELGRTSSRAHAVRLLVENTDFERREKKNAFVLMQYFGYLRRDPDEAGFNFWLQKLNDHGGNYASAEMVKSFLVSGEYKARFRY